MDILQLYADYGVQAQTEGHKHCRPGWINTECPFCSGNPGLHLGATLDGKVFYCWRCGIHWPDESIAKLLNIDRKTARRLIIEYAGISIDSSSKNPAVIIRAKSHKEPNNVLSLTPSHKSYLKKRGFDPDFLEEVWNLKSTGPIALLDKKDYGHRILAPIFWEGKQVTFQARDATGRHPLKYMACPKDRELIHHKHIIYRHPQAPPKKGICVEGITDVWRFGKSAFATFGIEFTQQQIRLIASLYDEVIVCFDNEIQAQRQADKLVADLRFRGVFSKKIKVPGDPGEMKQEEANNLVKSLM